MVQHAIHFIYIWRCSSVVVCWCCTLSFIMSWLGWLFFYHSFTLPTDFPASYDWFRFCSFHFEICGWYRRESHTPHEKDYGYDQTENAKKWARQRGKNDSNVFLLSIFLKRECGGTICTALRRFKINWAGYVPKMHVRKWMKREKRAKIGKTIKKSICRHVLLLMFSVYETSTEA